MKAYLTQAVYPSDVWPGSCGSEFTCFTDLVRSNPDVVATYIRNGSVNLTTIDDLDEALGIIILNKNSRMDQAYLDLFKTLMKVDLALVDMPIYPHSQFPGAKTTLELIRQQEPCSWFASQLYDIAISL